LELGQLLRIIRNEIFLQKDRLLRRRQDAVPWDVFHEGELKLVQQETLIARCRVQELRARKGREWCVGNQNQAKVPVPLQQQTYVRDVDLARQDVEQHERVVVLPRVGERQRVQERLRVCALRGTALTAFAAGGARGPEPPREAFVENAELLVRQRLVRRFCGREVLVRDILEAAAILHHRERLVPSLIDSP